MTTHDLVKKYLYDCIYSSAKIEGLCVTLPQTYEILDKAHVTDADLSDIYFVVNMKRAWEFMLDNLDYPINIMLLRQYNKICGNILIDGAGVLRTTGVTITGTSYVPPIPMLETVKSDLDKILGIQDIIDRAIEMFLYLSKAQLFIDGNKRLAQLVANHILVCNDVGILKVPDTQTTVFVDALIKHYEGSSNTLRTYLREQCLLLSTNEEYVVYKDMKFSVDEICNALPPATVSSYSSRKECAEDNVAMYYSLLF